MSGCCNSTTAAAGIECSTRFASSAPSWDVQPAISIEPRKLTLGLALVWGGRRRSAGHRAPPLRASHAGCGRRLVLGKKSRRSGDGVRDLVGDWRRCAAGCSANMPISSPRGPGSRPSTSLSAARTSAEAAAALLATATSQLYETGSVVDEILVHVGAGFGRAARAWLERGRAMVPAYSGHPEAIHTVRRGSAGAWGRPQGLDLRRIRRVHAGPHGPTRPLRSTARSVAAPDPPPRLHGSASTRSATATQPPSSQRRSMVTWLRRLIAASGQSRSIRCSR